MCKFTQGAISTVQDGIFCDFWRSSLQNVSLPWSKSYVIIYVNEKRTFFLFLRSISRTSLQPNIATGWLRFWSYIIVLLLVRSILKFDKMHIFPEGEEKGNASNQVFKKCFTAVCHC